MSGKIERKLKKIESIVFPPVYHNIFKEFCTVNAYDKNYVLYNFKKKVKEVVKNSLNFKSTEQKINFYIKGDKRVGVSPSYDSTPVRLAVLKRGATLQ